MSQGNLKSVCTTKQVYLYLNTSKRDSGTNTDAKFSSNNQQWGQDRMFNFRVRQIHIPNEFYNVYDGANKLEFVTEFSSPFTIQITPGRYTLQQLLDQVKNDLLVNHTITSSWIIRDGKVYWIMGTNIDLIGEQVPETKTDSLCRTLGFPLDNITNFKENEEKGPYVPFLNRPSIIKVFFDLVEDHTVDNNKLTNLLDTISLATTEYGSLASRYYDQGNNVNFEFPELRHLNSFRIRLTDQFDIPLAMPDNFEVSLFLVLGLNSV